jgi:hypothetical protein
MPAMNQIFPNPSNSGLPTDPKLLMGDAQLAATLYGEIGAQVGEQGQAAALDIEAGGMDAEAQQYGISAGIAEGNAQLALVGGDIQKYQAMRQAQKVIGTQQATGAASGFADAGSAVDVATSSMRQGLLQTQLIGTNADLQAGGYLEQASSARAEAGTATTAAGYERALAASATNQAGVAGQMIGAEKNLMGGLPGGQAIVDAVNSGNVNNLNPNAVIGNGGIINNQALMAQIMGNMNMPLGGPGAAGGGQQINPNVPLPQFPGIPGVPSPNATPAAPTGAHF